MIKRSSYIIFSCLLLFVFSCEMGGFIPFNIPNILDDQLSVTLTASADEIGLNEEIIISIEVKNAESLFAFSFYLIYNPDLFDTDSDAIIEGDLFVIPVLLNETEFLSTGEVQVGLYESSNTIQESVSGTACSIIFTSKSIGADLLYISSPVMINKNGDLIDDFSILSILPIPIEIKDVD